MELNWKKLALVGSVLLILSALIFRCSYDDDTLADISIPEDTLPPPKLNIEYGLNLDSFIVVEGRIKKNQVLSEILLKHHIPWGEIDKLVKVAKPVFSLRKLNSGKNYTVLCKKDSSEKAQFFIYEPNSISYVVYDLRGDMAVEIKQRKIREVRREVAGLINSSLYQTLMDIKVSPALAMELSEIYAWSIDFYRIQKGDRFKVIFKEQYVQEKRVGVGKVESALFEHHGELFYAFPFEQKGHVDYFDENAKSLRKAFLQSPLKYGRISSSFTRRRYHPVQKRWKAHLGTDYAAPKGTPILAVGDGVVSDARYKKFNGNYVKIKHNSTYTTQYLHMTGFAKGIKRGKFVRQGQVIGYVGSTGLATGPHVCFRFWKNGQQVNHRRQKLPPSLPIEKNLMPQFKMLKDSLKHELDNIPYENGEKAILAKK